MPTAEPSVPTPLRLFDEQHQTAEVAADAEVVEVTHRPPRERDVLRLDRLMSIASTPIVDGELPVEDAPSGSCTTSAIDADESAPSRGSTPGSRTCLDLCRRTASWAGAQTAKGGSCPDVGSVQSAPSAWRARSSHDGHLPGRSN